MQIISVIVLALQLSIPGDTLSLAAVEQIIGMPARLIDIKQETRPNVRRETTSYSALDKDPRSKQAVNLYYLKENYDNAELANTTFDAILADNRGLTGQAPITDLGDEAWLHSDQQNFILLMVRKKNQLIRIKINKLPPGFSSKDLLAAGRQIVAAL